MYLVNPSGVWTGHWFESTLSPNVDNPNRWLLPEHCRTTRPGASSWLLLSPAGFIESNVITSLNPRVGHQGHLLDSCRGGLAWDWWSGSQDAAGKRAFTTENMKYYVDFAAKSGFEYMLVDAGWSARDDITKMNGRVRHPRVGALRRHQEREGVDLGRLHRADDRQMDEAFPLYEKWGVAGIKTDFMMRDDQVGIDFYYRVAEKAAEHHLMVDFHGSTKPSGLERTYPNVMGYEAVLGMEQSKAGSRDNPDMHVMLPFTRMLAGPMDYTPGGFRQRHQGRVRVARPATDGDGHARAPPGHVRRV